MNPLEGNLEFSILYKNTLTGVTREPVIEPPTFRLADDLLYHSHWQRGCPSLILCHLFTSELVLLKVFLFDIMWRSEANTKATWPEKQIKRMNKVNVCVSCSLSLFSVPFLCPQLGVSSDFQWIIGNHTTIYLSACILC